MTTTFNDINLSLEARADGSSTPSDPDGLGGSFPESGISFAGGVGHGNTLIITDTEERFGTRANVKPLFVNFGDSLAGSSLGRITTSHINSNLVVDSVVKNGALPSSLKWDIQQFGQGGIIGSYVVMQDLAKPLIQYIERYNDFDYSDARIQPRTYYFTQVPYPNTVTYSITIDGRTYAMTNDGSGGSASNAAVVRAYLIDAINADDLCKCTADLDGDGTFRLTKKNSGEYFDVTHNAQIFQNFNNKTARIHNWNGSSNNNVYLITDNLGSRVGVENTVEVSYYYNGKEEVSAWMNEELVFKNSSAGGAADGFYRHYKDSELLNTSNSIVTYDSGEQPVGRCALNQFSNGPYGYWRESLDIYIGYQCWDDEYAGIYFADTETIVPGTTHLVRQPQTAWAAGEVAIQQVETFVPADGAHIHLRTDIDTYIYLGSIGA